MGRPPRTQAERREATIGKLIDATIASLAHVGYARTSVSEICKRAGVSHGGMCRHFDTRVGLVATATEAIGRDHVAAIDALAASLPDDADPVSTIVAFVREACRSPVQDAWHEVMVAARTDEVLREKVAPILQAYESALHDLAVRLFDPDATDPLKAQVVVMSILHLFDSEAVTRAVYSNPEIEAARLAWTTDLLRRELSDP